MKKSLSHTLARAVPWENTEFAEIFKRVFSAVSVGSVARKVLRNTL